MNAVFLWISFTILVMKIRATIDKLIPDENFYAYMIDPKADNKAKKDKNESEMAQVT